MKTERNRNERKHRTCRLLAPLGALLLMLAASQVVWAATTVPDYIKVGLKYSGTAVTSCTLQSDSGFVLGLATNDDFVVMNATLPGGSGSLDLSDYPELQVVLSDSGAVSLEDVQGNVLVESLVSEACLMPADYQRDGYLTIDGKNYRGGAMFYNKGSKFNVINYVTLNQYLRSVVTKEIGWSAGIEALKAQAVAARSYAMTVSSGKHASEGFAVCSTTNCQVYEGMAVESKLTNQAVEETGKECIWYDGKIVQAFFGSSSGGYTMNNEDYWNGTPLGYLRSVKDEYSPSVPWTASFTFAELKTKLEAAGYDPGTVTGVSIGSKTSYGYAQTLVVSGTKNTVTLSKSGIRGALGSNAIKSLNFSLSLGGESANVISSEADQFNLSLRSQSGTSANTGSSVFVMGADGTVAEQKPGSLYLTNGSKSVAAPFTASGTEKTVNTATSVTFNGDGYGHCVGMSQKGAMAMEKAGFSYKDILEYYYTDIEVK